MKKILRATAFLFGLFAMLAVSVPSFAADRSDYSQAKFDAATKAGKPVLIEVWASWCPVCRAQDPIIQSLMKEPEFAGLTILTVDFDKEKALLRTLNVAKQSTLIAFKGTTETGRTTGDTSPAGIRALTQKAL